MAATESEGATLHKEFCEFLLGVLRAKDENGACTCSSSWGAVIRAFLKDNSITTVPDDSEDATDPLSKLARQFHSASPPRRLDPDVDLDPDEVH